MASCMAMSMPEACCASVDPPFRRAFWRRLSRSLSLKVGSGQQPSMLFAPVTRRAAALETLFRADWERSAPRWHRNRALTAESYRRARIVVEHVLAPELAAPLTLLAARYA